MRKWTYPYLEFLAEQVRKMNEIFRSPGRAEVLKAELQIFGSKDRAELRKVGYLIAINIKINGLISKPLFFTNKTELMVYINEILTVNEN